MKKKVIVIGGGIAGLSAGIYAARCGFDVTILESRNIAGGNCTAWKRNGYLFEGGMHRLSGSDEDEPLNKVWRAVGALNGSVNIRRPEPFMVYDHNGMPIPVHRDTDETEKQLIGISPADEKEIKRLCRSVRRLKDLSTPVLDIKGVKVTRKSRMPPSMLFSASAAFRTIRKFSDVPVNKYVKRFGHEGIRNMILSVTGDGTGMEPVIFTMGLLARGGGGFPEGGSLPFVKRMTDTFRSLGGELRCGTRAERVLMEDNKATGVLACGAMACGERIRADAVMVATDTMAAEHLFEMPPKGSWLDEMRSVTVPTTAMFISIGINTDLSRHPHCFSFKLKRPTELASHTYEFIGCVNHSADRIYSPEGRTAMTVQLGGDTYEFWKNAKEEGRYTEEKQKVADAVMTALTEHIPEINGKAEICDVATPLTYERHCGSWKGSWMTEISPDMRSGGYPAVIDGFEGVYFAGHRMMPPGGLPAALLSGRRAVQYLCRDTGTTFISE
jgi:phytoene dehydrogenase-like protein